MRSVILAGVSTVALVLAGCSLFQSESSKTTQGSVQASRPAAAAPQAAPPAARSENMPAAQTSEMAVSSGDQIKQAQQKLQAEGLYKGKIDGIAGAKTKQALLQYQKQHNLAQTGTLDQRTMAALSGAAQGSASGSTSAPENTPGTISGKSGTAASPGPTGAPGATSPGAATGTSTTTQQK